MAVKTASQLKEQFSAGSLPKDTDYVDLIDSCLGGSTGPDITTVFVENKSYDEVPSSGKEFAYLYYSSNLSYSLLTTAQWNSLQSSSPGSVVIITNKKTVPFYVKIDNYDDGPDDDYPLYRIVNSSKEFVIAPNGSLMLIKVGNTYDSYNIPTVSAVATAVQGVVS